MKLTPELLKDIKAHADIVFVISNYIEVTKKGRNYMAMCPFHDDHNPSLHIDVNKQTFMCYVCKTGGDVFTFVEKYKKISFVEAVKEVAKITNFNDPRLLEETPVTKVDNNLAPLYSCITDLQKYYQYGLNTEEGQIALDYLKNRSITDEQIAKFGLGYSLNNGEITVNYLKNKNYSIKTISDIGITDLQSGKLSDKNAGRLIFPIKDPYGQVLGFSARTLKSHTDDPKYVNTSETKIFHKGFILYNLNNAKQSCKHDGYLYIVEGFMDVFALDSIGFPSVVALMGTKLTSDHVLLLKRLNVEIRLCLDGDAAGQKGMMAIMPMLDAKNIPYRIVSKPKEIRDPDEILKQDGEKALKDFITTLVDPFTFALNYYENTSPLGSREDCEKVIRHFIPMLTSVKNRLVYDNYLIKLSKVTGFEIGAIQNYINASRISKNNKEFDDVDENYQMPFEAQSKLQLNKGLRRLHLAEKAVILQMVNNKDAVKYFDDNIHQFVDIIYHQIASYILDYFDKNGDIDINSIIDIISLNDDENRAQLLSTLTGLIMEKNVPPFNLKAMEEYAETISKENHVYSTQQELKDELFGMKEEDKIHKMKQFIEQKKQNIAKKQSK